MRRFMLVLAFVLGACSAAPASSPAPTPISSVAIGPASVVPTVAPTRAPSAAVSFKAGDWPPDFQKFICQARSQLLREDALAGGIPGQDAATRALELMKSAPNWEPASDFRALLGKAGFVMLDASPRGGDFLQDIVDANAAFEAAYEELKTRTGFECPA